MNLSPTTQRQGGGRRDRDSGKGHDPLINFGSMIQIQPLRSVGVRVQTKLMKNEYKAAKVAAVAAEEEEYERLFLTPTLSLT